ncbi:hypothetical protein [Nitrosomonas sp. Is37]|uniref:hypothetical protein n=1 Tax=Nitrosomonas sp. Is37 TaxID=3080535 RepID=UPI00294AE27A|nr:hypothetical protein [Nitrosomonas sp. Is37]MDV6343961.1 hypothetical protein [Nitrosomonas sp. Is37]
MGRNDTVSALYARIATGSIVLAGWFPSPKGLSRASLEFRGGAVYRKNKRPFTPKLNVLGSDLVVNHTYRQLIRNSQNLCHTISQ